MVISYNQLQQKYADHSNLSVKIQSEIKKGNLIKLKRGLYCESMQDSKPLIANALYGPSYLSFEYALAHHSLIPERVYTFTSATSLKHKCKTFSNPLGTFSYQDIPVDAFAYGIIFQKNGAAIATKEKAIADTLYVKKPVNSIKELKELLFEDMRIDEDEFWSMNKEDLEFLLPRYRSKNTDLLNQLIRSHP